MKQILLFVLGSIILTSLNCGGAEIARQDATNTFANMLNQMGYTSFKVYLSSPKLGYEFTDDTKQLLGEKIIMGKMSIHNAKQSERISYTDNNIFDLKRDIPFIGGAGINFESISKVEIEIKNIKRYDLEQIKLNPAYAGMPEKRKKPFIASLLFAEKLIIKAYSKTGASTKFDNSLLASLNLKKDTESNALIGAENAFIGFIVRNGIGDAKGATLTAGIDPINEQPGGAPLWISGQIGVKKKGKKKVIECVAKGVGLSEETAKGIAQNNGFEEMALSSMAIFSVQSERILSEKLSAGKAEQESIFKKMSSLELNKVKLSGIMPKGTYWRQVQLPQHSQPMYEYYILYQWDYKEYVKTRKRLMKQLIGELSKNEKKLMKKVSKGLNKADKNPNGMIGSGINLNPSS